MPLSHDWAIVRYPHPNCLYTKFNLSDLSDPPADYAPWGETFENVIKNQRFRKEALVKLCDFHFWGIDPGDMRNTIAGRLEKLFKLFYHQAERHKPRTINAAIDFTRDAGPRLLDPVHFTPRSLLPISRWHPLLPIRKTVNDPAFLRPTKLAQCWSDVYWEQFIQSVSSMPADVKRALDNNNYSLFGFTNGVQTITDTTGTAGSTSNNIFNNDDQGGRATRSSTKKKEAQAGPALALTLGAPQGPPLGIGPGSGPGTAFGSALRTVPASGTGLVPGPRPVPTSAVGSLGDLSLFSSNLLRNISLPHQNSRKVAECIERALIGIAYEDLERDPSAAPQQHAPRPVTAAAPGDLSKAIIGSFPATSHVRLTHNGATMAFDANGQLYPFRGRGPVEQDESSLLDCVIFAGKLLDAGSTRVDRKEQSWHSKLSPLERAFIELTDINWDLCTADAGARIKRAFCDLLAQTAVQGQTVFTVGDVWEAVAHNFAQFKSTYLETCNNCPCTARGGVQPQQYDCNFIGVPMNAQAQNPATMESLLQSTFEPYHLIDCPTCGQANTVGLQRLFQNLPLRMAVRLADGIWVENHTQDITIQYQDDHLNKQTAVYRWLGGIYHNGTSYRVFWTDNGRGEASAGEVRVYDSRENEGVLVGGIAPEQANDRVPETWYRYHAPPLLFYERVLNPHTDTLRLAVHTACNMLKVAEDDRMILKEHVPWPQPEIYNPGEYPWQKNLSLNDPQRFHLAQNAYDPNSHHKKNINPTLQNQQSVFNHLISADGDTTELGMTVPITNTFAAYVPPLPSVGSSGFSPGMLAGIAGNSAAMGTVSPSGLSQGAFQGLAFGTPPSQDFMLLTQPFDPPSVPDSGDNGPDPAGTDQTGFSPTAISSETLEQATQEFLAAHTIRSPLFLPNTGGNDALAEYTGTDGLMSLSPVTMQDLDMSEYLEMSEMCRGQARPRPIILVKLKRPLPKRVIEELGSDDEAGQEQQNGRKKQKRATGKAPLVAKTRAQKKQASLRMQMLQKQALLKAFRKG